MSYEDKGALLVVILLILCGIVVVIFVGTMNSRKVNTESVECTPSPKFIQIASRRSGHILGLDENGRVWTTVANGCWEKMKNQ